MFRAYLGSPKEIRPVKYEMAQSATKDEYLQAIWTLADDPASASGPVISARLAEFLSLSGASVSEMIHRLEREGLVRLNGRKEIVLTDRGTEVAAGIVRRHRLIERMRSDSSTRSPPRWSDDCLSASAIRRHVRTATRCPDADAIRARIRWSAPPSAPLSSSIASRTSSSTSPVSFVISTNRDCDQDARYASRRDGRMRSRSRSTATDARSGQTAIGRCGCARSEHGLRDKAG